MTGQPETTIRVAIVDDETPARELLALMLSHDSTVELVGSFATGTALLAALNDTPADVLLLDIGLPGEDGVEVARRCLNTIPDVAVVFVTAFDDRAIEAFEINAIDYLLKPVEDSRLREAVARARQRLHRNRYTERIGWAADAIKGLPNRDTLIVRSVRKIDIVSLSDVHCFLAAGNYVEVRLDGKTLLHRISCDRLVKDLDPAQFMRVHRSAIVNLHHVSQVITRSKGRRTLVMKNGDKVLVSNRYLKQVVNALE